MAKCLVLGANGFIGSHVVDKLVANGHSVRCFDRYKTGDTLPEDTPSVEYISGNFLNRANLSSALEGVDYVFHFISTTTPVVSENDPLIDIETNILMSVTLFSLCAEHNVRKVIFASTGGAIYGDIGSNEPLHEELRPQPVSPYAIGKLSIENYLRYFKKKYGLDYMIARISNPYGPRQNTLSGQGVISIFLEKLLQKKPITVYGDGSMVRDYIYVEDVAEMIVRTFDKPNKKAIYNIGSGMELSVNQLIEEMECITGEKFTKETKETPSTFVHSVVLDTHRYREEFGALQPTPLKEGILRTWQNLQKR